MAWSLLFFPGMNDQTALTQREECAASPALGSLPGKLSPGLRRRSGPDNIIFSSPRNTTTEGGEHMMIATLLIGAWSLAAMVTGYIVMVRD